MLLLHFARLGHKKREAIFDKSRFVSDGFLFSMPFGFYSKLCIFDYDRDFVSFNAAKVRILFEPPNIFQSFFEVVLPYPI